jgi:hypothetical protein
MLVKIFYPADSNIADTSPMIRILFQRAVEADILLHMQSMGIRDLPKFIWSSDELMGTESAHKIRVMYGSAVKPNAKISASLDRAIAPHWWRAYNAIKSFEALLDVCGGDSPDKLFGACCFDEMKV